MADLWKEVEEKDANKPKRIPLVSECQVKLHLAWEIRLFRLAWPLITLGRFSGTEGWSIYLKSHGSERLGPLGDLSRKPQVPGGWATEVYNPGGLYSVPVNSA